MGVTLGGYRLLYFVKYKNDTRCKNSLVICHYIICILDMAG